MKKATQTRTQRNFDYPAESKGSQVAARVRSDANNLTESQREELFKKGMQLIYGGNGAKETVGRR